MVQNIEIGCSKRGEQNVIAYTEVALGMIFVHFMLKATHTEKFLHRLREEIVQSVQTKHLFELPALRAKRNC